MADPVTVTTPDFRGTVDQRYFLRPLGGPAHPQNYLNRFPEEVYNKSIDSHLVRFMYALIGPAGIGWLEKNYLDARLKLEDFGLETFDLDKFYGDPLKFGRILEEIYDEDPKGLLPRDKWEEIRAKDAKYRNRAIDYVNGARAGNTPFGMRLVARSGLGHEVEIIENYRYYYDQLADEQLGIQNFGFTNSTEEFVVVPRRELPRNEVQQITVNGNPTSGTFRLFFPVGNEATNSTGDIPIDALGEVVKTHLEGVDSIGVGNVAIYGGPLPDLPMQIVFIGELAHRDVPKLQVTNVSLSGGTSPSIVLTEEDNGVSTIDEVVAIGPRDKKHLHEALSRIRPVASIATFGKGTGTQTRQTWNTAFASSTYIEVVRFVTGKAGVSWPERDEINWIEPEIEHQAQRASGDLQQHYAGFHNIGSIVASSSHIGPFSQYQRQLYPILNTIYPVDHQYLPDHAPADYAEPLTIRTRTPSGEALVNGIYPASWQNLSGIDQIRYKDEQFWASDESLADDEWLEIDLGAVRPVNYVYFEATRKPFDIEVSYDILDMAPDKEWRVVTPESDIQSPTGIGYTTTEPNPWTTIDLYFETARRTMIFTRFLRIKFTRRSGGGSPFESPDGTQFPFSIEVRNLRVGRNVF